MSNSVNPPSIIIRPHSDAHIPAELNRYVHDQHIPYAPQFFKPYSFVEIHAAITEMLKKSGAFLFVAWQEETPIGYALGWPNSRTENAFAHAQKSLLLDQMAVHPAFRQRGIGKLLLHKVEQYAAEKQFAQLEISVWLANDGAKRLYLEYGFEPQVMTLTKKLGKKKEE